MNIDFQNNGVTGLHNSYHVQVLPVLNGSITVGSLNISLSKQWLNLD